MKVALASVIAKAELRAELELGSPLGYSTGVDTFQTTTDLFCGVVPPEGLRLRLSRKFARNTVDDPVLVLDGTTVVPPSDYTLESGSGLLVLDPAYADRKVSVEYTSGFSDGDDLPPSLKEALLLLGTMIATINQTGEKESGAQEASKRSGDMATGFLSVFNPVMSFCFRPITKTRTSL
jgi:hypothetical protein